MTIIATKLFLRIYNHTESIQIYDDECQDRQNINSAFATNKQLPLINRT